MKGFMRYDTGSAAFPHSLEWFYMPLSALQQGLSTFDWDSLDTELAGIAARGHQAVFRVYIDYPDKPYGMPAFLSSVAKHSYTDDDNGSDATSYSPDYTDPNLRRALKNYVAALGARFDGDPRIGGVTIGLLGFWGEWHTYPHTEWMAPPEVMTEVLDSYGAAFHRTLLIAREPKPGVMMDRPLLGFEDDSFAYETLGNPAWFWPKMVAANLTANWQTRPMGGEVRPEVQPCIWNDPSCTPPGQDYNTCVDTTHASFLLNQTVFDGLAEPMLDRATAGAARLGYTFYVSGASLEGVVAVGAPLTVTLQIVNLGVAPFYYPWTVDLAAEDSSGNMHIWQTPWDLRTLLPSPQSTPLTFTVAAPGLNAGQYVLLLGVENPLPGGTPLRFANQTQDQNVPGWLSLGSFTLK